MGGADVLLEYRDVRFAYPGASRGTAALDGICLTVREGGRIAVLGANGSGKSTLLRHANGLLAPLEGAMFLDGRKLSYDRPSLREWRRRVAMVFQDPDDQIFAATVEADVAYGPSNLGLPLDEIRRRASWAMRSVGISDLADHPPQILSQGTRKKVAIAGALAMEPDLLVLDEPTAGLDPASVDELSGILAAVSASGTSVLLSTHDVDFAADWATEAVLLHQGRILSCGPIDRVLSEREHLRTCRLRTPRRLVGMARTGTREPVAKEGGIHVLHLHPSARVASESVARELEASLHVHRDDAASGEDSFERLAVRLEEIWESAAGIVLFAPVGVAVRSLAPLLRHKLSDPAVVCCDVHGRWAVSLLSGHEGGANDLAARVSRILEAEPIVTTTSEASRTHVVGIGCRRGVESAVVAEALDMALERIGLERTDLRLVATTEAKRDDAAIAQVASDLGIPLRIVSHREIRVLRPRVRKTAASRHFNVAAVSEPAALLAGRRTECVLRKFVHKGVTISVARELCAWSESAPGIRLTEPVAPKRPSPHPAS